ncbi:MAG: YbaB/EbfC family nucleoid-associated protein [Clostridia bacterium]|nr:YbaB/EbfC family nucleoid-associated protein [Clostridia bacterium]
MARGGFPGIPGGNMQQLMRQAQKMQQQMLQLQEDLDKREYEGTAGGGAVSCKVSGKRQLIELNIDQDAVDPEEVEMLQDMILAAVNDALKKGEETREREMAKIGGAAGMGGMF